MMSLRDNLLAAFQRVQFLSIVEQTCHDGQFTERAELDSGRYPSVGRVVWYGFSLLCLPDFPSRTAGW